MAHTTEIEEITISTTQLSIDLTNASPMTLDEAEAAWAQVNMAAEVIQWQLLELYHRQAWKSYVNPDGSLVYSGWQECAMEKLRKGRTAIYYALKCVETQSRLIEKGLDQFTTVNLPQRHLRIIAQTSENQQVEAAKKLLEWAKLGETTAKDAEAALWSVDQEKRCKKVEKLVGEYIVSNPEKTATRESILKWAEEEKGYSSRQIEVLGKEDVKVFVNNRQQSSAKMTADSDKSPTPVKPDKSLEIASLIASYEPEELARGILAAADDYAFAFLAAALPKLPVEEAIAYFQEAKLTKEEATKVSDKAFEFCQAIDDAFV